MGWREKSVFVWFNLQLILSECAEPFQGLILNFLETNMQYMWKTEQ